MAGKKERILEMCNRTLDVLDTEMLSKTKIDTEQVLLQMVWSRFPHLFQWVIPPPRWHNCWGTYEYPELSSLWSQQFNKALLLSIYEGQNHPSDLV
jgi:hypothetical protein